MMPAKLRLTKTVLWFLAGLGATVLVMRIIHGPGSVTALTDIIPWGLWKGGGVVALVAIGGAGFTLAMFVYVFSWERYRPVVRGAVLLALMCYVSVGVGLTFDIGIWWRIVFPVFHWQIHSVLFEVAWCIMLYLVVLSFEFSHNILEKYGWTNLLRVAEKATMVFVVLGISLSTLHQSSLGTLFLATPFRLHPLWHTDFLPLLFFISAIGLGCLTISVATLLVHWLYDEEPPMYAISGLGKIAAVVTSVYFVVKMVEIVVTGEAHLLLDASWDTANFWLEILLTTVVPVLLPAQKRYRESKTAMFWIGLCATMGLGLNRVNVAGLATLSLTNATYFPAWTEWAVTLGVLAVAGIFYLFAVEHLGLFRGVRSKEETGSFSSLDFSDWRTLIFVADPRGEVRLYSFTLVAAIALSFGMLPEDSVRGVAPVENETARPRRISLLKTVGTGQHRAEWAFPYAGQAPGAIAEGQIDALMLDGNRDGRLVLFDHDAHLEESHGGNGRCAECHHAANPLDKATSCYECHSDVYLPRDIFDHGRHNQALGGNDGCAKCHQDLLLPKIRENTPACETCHAGMWHENSRIRNPETHGKSMAPGYVDAMHGLCARCHEEKQARRSKVDVDVAQCTYCHRTLPDFGSSAWDPIR